MLSSILLFFLSVSVDNNGKPQPGVFCELLVDWFFLVCLFPFSVLLSVFYPNGLYHHFNVQNLLLSMNCYIMFGIGFWIFIFFKKGFILICLKMFSPKLFFYSLFYLTISIW